MFPIVVDFTKILAVPTFFCLLMTRFTLVQIHIATATKPIAFASTTLLSITVWLQKRSTTTDTPTITAIGTFDTTTYTVMTVCNEY